VNDCNGELQEALEWVKAAGRRKRCGGSRELGQGGPAHAPENRGKRPRDLPGATNEFNCGSPLGRAIGGTLITSLARARPPSPQGQFLEVRNPHFIENSISP